MYNYTVHTQNYAPFDYKPPPLLFAEICCGGISISNLRPSCSLPFWTWSWYSIVAYSIRAHSMHSEPASSYAWVLKQKPYAKWSQSMRFTQLWFTQLWFTQLWLRASLVPRPPPFFVLRFSFSTIHGSGRARKTGKAWEHLSREWRLVDARWM